MKALLVIDMQVGSFQEDQPRYDASGVIQRINEVAKQVRITRGLVIFVQHQDQHGFQPGTKNWEILPSLERLATDLCVSKQACDAFYETELANVLEKHDVQQL